MQQALSSYVPSMAIATAAAASSHLPVPLEEIFKRVRLSLVEFNAQDVYQICTTIYNNDTIGMLQDPEFMRGLSSAFKRSDQSVLSPFQANLVNDVFLKANVVAMPKDVAMPEPDAVSPESLINVLRAMNITKRRDEKKMSETLRLMFPMLEEFSPSQLSLTISELSWLKCTEGPFMNRLAKRALEVCDDLSELDISVITKSLCYCHGVQHSILLRVFSLVEARCKAFQSEDFINVLHGLNSIGPKYSKTLNVLVDHALENVENMDCNSLTAFLVCFASLDYRNRTNIEIFGEALIEVAEDLKEKDLIEAFTALCRLQLLTPHVFAIFSGLLLHYVPTMDPRNIAPIIDICSSVPHKSDMLMMALLERSAECTRILTPGQLGDILSLIAHYPPARQHRIVPLFGRQTRMRMDLMGPEQLAGCIKGLSNLGYAEPELYLQACETFFRFGFKDFSLLEPMLQGLSLAPASVSPGAVKILASYTAPLAHGMTLQQVERANKYLCTLNCEDQWVYKKLAERVRNFIKDVTPDMPQDLQLLLQKGAVQT
jgi:hypothetical protein